MKIWEKILSVLLAVVMVFTLASCRNAPAQEDSEADSGDTALDAQTDVSAVEEEPEESGTIIEEDGTVRQVDTFTSDDGWVTFMVDAVVEGSDITELPMITVAPNYYDSEELKQISEAFADDQTVYAYTEILTKTELEFVREDLAALVDGYLSGESENAHLFTEEERQKMIAEWQALIDHLDEDYKTAPDEPPYNEPVYEYGVESRYDQGKDYFRAYYGGKNVFRALYKEGGRVMDIVAYQTEFTDTGGTEPLIGRNVIYSEVDNKRSGSSGYTYAQQTPFTDEEIDAAVEKVMRVVNNMGYGDWKLIKMSESAPREGKSDFGYFLYFRFMPQFYDVPMEIDMFGAWVYSTDEHTDAIAQYEGPALTVSYSGGEILSIGCDNDIEVVSESEPMELLSYEEMLDTIYDYAANRWGIRDITTYSPYSSLDNENYTYNLHINKISLGYIRTVSEGAPYQYELLPVWVVYGHQNVVKYYIGNTTIEGISTYPGYQGNPDESMQALMIFNAYDGSPITSEHLLFY